ncbi:MAG: hypothetical protein ACFFCI_04255 [Promethearchaeota archaeon]
MTKKVLIAYESRYGYVTQVANFVKDILIEKGLETINLDVERMSTVAVYPLEQYQGIIIGICENISAFKKLKKTFIKKDLGQYKEDSHPVAVFTNSPLNIPVLFKPESEHERYQLHITKKFRFRPDICEIFKPVLDFTAFSPLESYIKSFRKSISRKAKGVGIELDYKGVNDLRDWPNIKKFTERFIMLLN